MLETIANPVSLLKLYGLVGAVFFALLLLYTWRDVWAAALDSLRLVSVMSIIVAPIYSLASNNWDGGTVLLLSGLLTLILITVIFKNDLRYIPRLSQSGDEDGDT